MSQKLTGKKTVLIIGGGFAGTKIARALSASLSPSRYDIVLVDPRPYHVLLPAAVRMVVSDATLEASALVPFDRLFHNGNGRFVQGKVLGVYQSPGTKAGSVTLESGEEIVYDVLTICTGSSWKGHIALPFGNVEDWVRDQREKFAKANNILLIGAGAIGLGTFNGMRPSESSHL